MKKIRLFLFCVITTELVGILSGLAVSSSLNPWFASLQKPSFNPPAWLFGPVWTLLYFLMGTALYLVIRQGWHRKEVREATAWYGVQLFANGLWSILFFGLHSIDAALIDIGALLVLIIINILVFLRIKKTAAYILLPYLGWVLFASVLNYALAVLN